MRVYKSISSVNYQFFNTDSLVSSRKVDRRDFSEEEKIIFTKVSSEKLKYIGDIALINSSCSMVFSEKAKSVFSNAGSFFKFTNLEDFELFTPETIDALDYEKSEFRYFSDGRIMGVEKFIFKEELISNVEAFRIKDFNAYPTFLTDKFVEKYKANNLTGIEFFCVYDSENPANVGKFIQEM